MCRSTSTHQQQSQNKVVSKGCSTVKVRYISAICYSNSSVLISSYVSNIRYCMCTSLAISLSFLIHLSANFSTNAYHVSGGGEGCIAMLFMCECCCISNSYSVLWCVELF